MSVSAWLVVLAAGAAAVDPLAQVLYGRYRPQNRRDVNYMQVRLGDDYAREFGDDYPFAIRRLDDKPPIHPPKQSLWAKMFQSKDDYDEYETTRICFTIHPTPKVTPSTTPQVICYTPIIGRKGPRTSTKFTTPTPTTKHLSTTSSKLTTKNPSTTMSEPTTKHPPTTRSEPTTKHPSTTRSEPITKHGSTASSTRLEPTTKHLAIASWHPRTTCRRLSTSRRQMNEYTHEKHTIPTKSAQVPQVSTHAHLSVLLHNASTNASTEPMKGHNLTSARATLPDHIWHVTPLRSSKGHPSIMYKHSESTTHPAAKPTTPLKWDMSHSGATTHTRQMYEATRTSKTFPFLKVTRPQGCAVALTRRTTRQSTTRSTRRPGGCAVEITTTTQAPVDEFLAAWAFYRHHNSQNYPIRNDFHEGTVKLHKQRRVAEKANENVVLFPPWLQRRAPAASGMAFLVPSDVRSKQRRDIGQLGTTRGGPQDRKELSRWWQSIASARQKNK